MKLSVFVVTYNQEQYIRQCLDSIVMQQTNFDYEVVIGEDCSTDSTPQICDEYAEKYPFIKVYHHPKNLGLVKNWEFVLNRCTGEYVAMIEGDDYWTNPKKLQTQVEWMDKHLDYSITCTNIDVIYTTSEYPKEDIFPIRTSREYTSDEILKDWIVLTSSVVFRKLNRVIKYPKPIYICDTYTFLEIMRYGKCYLLPQKHTAYRRHVTNITRTELGYDSDIKWAIQYNYFTRKLYKKSLRYIARNREIEWLNCVINLPYTINGVLRCRLRYIQLHPRLIFSKFFFKTVKLYIKCIIQ